MMTTPKRDDDQAAAEDSPQTPIESPENTADTVDNLDNDELVDEQGEESFPASDPPGNF